MEDLLLDQVRSLKPRPQLEAIRRARRRTVITVTMLQKMRTLRPALTLNGVKLP